MNKRVPLILFSILLILMSSSAFADKLCYKANKSDFIQSLGTSYDIIFDISELKEKQLICLSFASLLPVPYAEGSFDYYCTEKNKGSNHYKCFGDDDSGKMDIHLDDGGLEVNVKFATMANTTDDPVIHKIKSKKNTFTPAYKTVCPKPNIFQSAKEKHLPFVCYNYKEDKPDKHKTVYTGCTRYNKICKSIGSKHFGKYPNDHESYKAFQRCKNSTPHIAPKISLTVKSQTFVKSESQKKKLLNSISIKNITIYDLDYYDDLVIAVGEDDSEKTRKLQTQDEYHEAVVVRSLDGGKTWRKIGKGLESSVPHDKVIVLDNKRILVASSIEGAGGTIVLSEDSGDTWDVRYSNACIESIKQIKGNTIVGKTFGPTIKSIDGGKNWVDVP